MTGPDPATRVDGPTWTGLLDLDKAGSITGAAGPVRPDHILARVLVRVHGAPLGYITVPPQPEATLEARARATAESTLASALQDHAHCSEPLGHDLGVANWTARTACPLHFPANDGVGVTVAIPTRNRTEYLRTCLTKIQQVTYEPLEIMVVDNAPTDSRTKDLVLELARDDARIVYDIEPSRGASAARNLALSRARFDIVAFTDDDDMVDTGWVSALVAGFTADPEVTCVTGFVAASALDNPFQRYFEFRYPHQGLFEPARFDMDQHRRPSRLYPFEAGIFGRSANMAVRRSAALQVDGFDRLLGAGALCRSGEDLDLFVRLLLDGGRIGYVPAALVWHRHREDADALNHAVYAYGYGLGAYLSKHLSNRILRTGLLAKAASLPGPQVARMKSASQSSQLGSHSVRLSMVEAYGLLAGAVGYRVTARRQARSASPEYR